MKKNSFIESQNLELKVEEKESFGVGTIKLNLSTQIHINLGLLGSRCLNGRVRNAIKLDAEAKEEPISVFTFVSPIAEHR